MTSKNLAKKTIALLHPGEMGAAIGAGLVSRGHRVVWASAGRGASTRKRAADCGLEDAATLAHAAQAADIVFSVCPPHAAMEVARAVAACGFGGVYIDANAVSPETTRALGRVVEAAGASYVDAGIIGPPPIPGASVRLYLCGSRAGEIAPLFEGHIMQAITLEGAVGAASALKVSMPPGTRARRLCSPAYARSPRRKASMRRCSRNGKSRCPTYRSARSGSP